MLNLFLNWLNFDNIYFDNMIILIKEIYFQNTSNLWSYFTGLPTEIGRFFCKGYLGLCHIIFGDSELLTSESFPCVKASSWGIQNSGQDRSWPMGKCVKLFVKTSWGFRCYIDRALFCFPLLFVNNTKLEQNI